MQKLFPIATAETRHLFVHPSMREPWAIVGAEGYTGEGTSYLKPGKVKNLLKLCKPEAVTFTVFEEPDPDTMAIDGILFGIKDIHGSWVTVRVWNVNAKVEKLNAGQWGLEGTAVVLATNLLDINTGYRPDLDPKSVINIPVKLRYDRATRELEWSSDSSYDKGLEVLGITLNLDWKDSKKFAL